LKVYDEITALPFISAVSNFRNKKQEQLRTVPVEKR